MGLDIGSAVNSCASWACTAPLVRCIINNPIYTSLLITALVGIVLVANYRQVYARSKSSKTLRTMLYIFFLVGGVMFLHHYATQKMATETIEHDGVQKVFTGIQSSRTIGGAPIVPVLPRGFEVEEEPAPAATGGEPPYNIWQHVHPAQGGRVDNVPSLEEPDDIRPVVLNMPIYKVR